jgi:glucokinase
MSALALGIDIGGTNTKFGLVDRRGDIVEKGQMSTTGFDTVQEYIAELANNIRPLLARAGTGNVKGIGVGAPNANYYTGEIVYAANLSWKGIIPFASLLKQSIHLDVTITNDANAAALGEMMYGVAKGMKEFIMITLGTGVGSGFITHGQLVYGDDGFGGEFGHVIAIRDGRQCGCGRKGCLETYTSATGIVRTAREWLEERGEDSLLRHYGDNLTAQDIQEAAAASDPVALEIFEYTGKILGQCLADAVAITAPKAIVFFGGLARAGELILGPTRRHMEENLLHVHKNRVEFLQSALPDSDAAILGASALAW